MQALAVGHAAAHADQPHKHYGVTCDLKAVAEAPAVLPKAEPVPQPAPAAEPLVIPDTQTPFWSRPPGRAPPPRSPPFLQQ